MVDGHGPQTGVGNVRPMNTGMEHHGTSHTHYGLYGSFSNSILVTGTYTREGGYLVECIQMFGVFGGGEGRPIVGVILLDIGSQRLVLRSGSHVS